MMVRIPTKISLIKPNHFKINEMALPTNKFMTKKEYQTHLQERVFKEHEGLYQALLQHNFDVSLYENTIPDAPDALFGNNWISVHHPPETGFTKSICILYPMALENRRIEVREDIVQDMCNCDIIDLRMGSNWAYLEGTGSIVFDRYHKTMYASLSPRTYYWKLLELSQLIDYKVTLCYSSYKGSPVYHTNVLMSIGETWAVVCFEVLYECNHNKIRKQLKDSNRDIIEISSYQMTQYCGNIIEIVNQDGIPYTIMSTTAYHAFIPDQLIKLGNIIHVPFETIETYGGGGVRCCITEI